MSDQTSCQEREAREQQNLADFDRHLLDLYRELQRDPASSLIQTAATGILEGQRGKLLYNGECSASYAQHGGVAWGRIEQLTWLDRPQRKALRALLDALAAVAYGADTSRQKKENVKKLTAAVEDYGELRNLPIAGSGDRAQGGTSPLNEREQDILRAMVLLKADGERRRRTRQQVTRKIDPACKSASYNKAFASLVRRQLVANCKGPGAGVWLTAEGASAAKKVE